MDITHHVKREVFYKVELNQTEVEMLIDDLHQLMYVWEYPDRAYDPFTIKALVTLLIKESKYAEGD